MTGTSSGVRRVAKTAAQQAARVADSRALRGLLCTYREVRPDVPRGLKGLPFVQLIGRPCHHSETEAVRNARKQVVAGPRWDALSSATCSEGGGSRNSKVKRRVWLPEERGETPPVHEWHRDLGE
eukprot:Rhum_TRINITY_DN14679_c3_g1::Rhum_TRINITY_DN14679_c3_g1_i1::g.110335::m.110335